GPARRSRALEALGEVTEQEVGVERREIEPSRGLVHERYPVGGGLLLQPLVDPLHRLLDGGLTSSHLAHSPRHLAVRARRPRSRPPPSAARPGARAGARSGPVPDRLDLRGVDPARRRRCGEYTPAPGLAGPPCANWRLTRSQQSREWLGT